MMDFVFWALVLVLGVTVTIWGWYGRKRESELKKILLGRVPSVTITKPSWAQAFSAGEHLPKTKCRKCGVDFEPAFTLRVPLTAVGLIVGYSIGARLEPAVIIPTLMMFIANRYVDMIVFGFAGHQIGRRYGRCPGCGTFQRLSITA